MLLKERCPLKENIIYHNRGSQNFLNKERWYHSKATWGTPCFCAEYSFWGLHTDLIASLSLQETQFLIWTGATGLAPTNTVKAALADAQEAVNSVSCWLFMVLMYKPWRD